AAASFGPHRTFCRSQTNAAAAGFDLRRSADISQVDTSSAGAGFHSPGAALYLNAAAASLEYSFLHSGDNDQAADTTLGDDLTLGRSHIDASSASMQAELAADRARVIT